ncbi:hypothetical protein ACFWN2_09615 [Lentzea sp. NPDC058436]|uniref:hypothetical protein n=1 Tax=Lentzea sp. NPDC058436 TaxID=3346499 RepID=UPI0036460C4D
MSEHSVRLVEVSLTAAEASRRAPVVTAWLLERGVIAANDSWDPLMAPSEFQAGPGSSSVCSSAVAGPNTGVDVVVERRVHHAGGNYEPPACPGCGSAVPDHLDLIEPWLCTGVEPSVRCACGLSTSAGDLVGVWACHVGELAVVFHNWPVPAPAFVTALSAVMGPRTRVVIGRT